MRAVTSGLRGSPRNCSTHGNVYLNLYVTFTAIGLWHGSGLNFEIYGWVRFGGAVVTLPIATYHRAGWCSRRLVFDLLVLSRGGEQFVYLQF
jgi:hypothetical protein